MMLPFLSYRFGFRLDRSVFEAQIYKNGHTGPHGKKAKHRGVTRNAEEMNDEQRGKTWWYNTLAPAKYASAGREYRYSLPETKKS